MIEITNITYKTEYRLRPEVQAEFMEIMADEFQKALFEVYTEEFLKRIRTNMEKEIIESVFPELPKGLNA